MLKSLSGDGAALVPVDTVFPVTATWTDLLGDEQQVALELKAGTPTVLEDLPLGTEVTLTEDAAADLPANAKWLGGTWTNATQNVAIDGEGSEVAVTVADDPGTAAEVALNNEFEKIPDLATTGGGFISGGVIALVVLLIGGGALLIFTRRKQHA